MSPELEELLRAARTEEHHLAPTFDDRQRVRQKLRLALGGGALLATSSVVSGAEAAAATGSAVTSVVAGTAEASALGGASFLSGVPGLKLAGWLLVGSALGLGGAWTSRGLLGVERPADPRSETRGHGPSEVAGAPRRSQEEREPSEPDETAELAPGSAATSDLVKQRFLPVRVAQPRVAAPMADRESTKAPERAGPRENILEESRRLKAAQAALSGGDLAQAQAELDATSGTLLEPERLGLEAITACRRGEESRARRLAAHVLTAYPSAPIVSRLRRELASGCRAGHGKTSTDPGINTH